MRRVPDILGFTHEKQLESLTARDFNQGEITTEEFDHIFRLCGSLWQHNGDPRRPHAELTFGKCSNGYVNVGRVLRHANLTEIFADHLASLLFRWQSRAPCRPIPHWTVGSDHASATLSYAIGVRLRCEHDFMEKGPGKSQLWKRHTIPQDSPILQVEELVNTIGTLEAVRQGLRQAHDYPLTFYPAVLTLVSRSTSGEFEGSPILAWRHYDMQNWDPADCPLCKAGSQRLRPKEKDNWAMLNAA